MNGTISYRLWLMPLLFFESYLAFTVFLFFFGPWSWPVSSPLALVLYLAASQVFIAVGYLASWRSNARAILVSTWKSQTNFRAVALLKQGIIVTAVLFLPTSLSRTGDIFPDVVFGVTNPGLAYNINFERQNFGNPYVFVEYIRMVLSVLLSSVTPLAIVYWSRLTRTVKFLSIAALAMNISLYLATGTNKGFADLIIALPWLALAGYKIGSLNIPFGWKVLVPAFASLFILFLVLFGLGQYGREGGVGKYGVFNTGTEIIEADKGHAVSILLEPQARVIFQSLTLYVTQGYYALSLGFEVKHGSTYGFGNSMFLARNADTIFSTNYFTRESIPGLIEEKFGWGMYTLWHSIYPWIASDVGFLGALMIMAILGYLLGRSWLHCLRETSPLWFVLFNYLIIIFFYIPANNQLFQGGEATVGFWLVLGSLIFRKMSNNRNRGIRHVT